MTEKIGFIGLGIMGGPMAKNLMEAGYEVVLYNRTREKAEEIAGNGTTVTDSPREVAEGSDVVLTMLPDSPEVREVVAGEDGILEGIEEGSLLVDMSTISPVVTEELAAEVEKKGARMLDAPVSGGEPGAVEGTLSIMVGGREEDFERVRPIFDVLGDTVVRVGEVGSGQVVKACNQIVVALVIEAVSEALVLAARGGADPAKVLEALSGGLAASRVLEVKGEKLLSRTFEPGGKVEYHRKDLGIALAAGREHGAALPATALVDQMFGALMSKGRGGWDHSALVTLIEEWSGASGS
jgi:2-hydroxy-3-oxopropionate reductase